MCKCYHSPILIPPSSLSTDPVTYEFLMIPSTANANSSGSPNLENLIDSLPL
jgi:hypothetical protein